MATDPRPIDIAALTPSGAALAERLHGLLKGSRLRLPSRLVGEVRETLPFDRIGDVIASAFAEGRDLVCIMATGIVVRKIAPHLRSKATDPAVVVVDERGRFVISLLSGHLGGANRLTYTVAELLGATPVVTTATDVQGLPPIDRIAADRGLVIENLGAVKAVHMALLEGRPVRIVDPEDQLRDVAAQYPDAPLVFVEPAEVDETESGVGVVVDYHRHEVPAGWLKLTPRVLCAGIGCNRGTDAAEILELIHQTLQTHRLSPAALKVIASIDVKRDEPGLLAATRTLGVDTIWFPAEDLKQVKVPHPSGVVASHVGTASVSEAAALKAAENERLLVPKQKSKNATLAVAVAGGAFPSSASAPENPPT